MVQGHRVQVFSSLEKQLTSTTKSGQSGNSPSRPGWFDRWAPGSVRPWLILARVDKPAGYWLLMWPCWWGVALASPDWPDFYLLFLFTVGAIVMRSAGCIVNDLADRKIDRQVERTRSRPLASGEISLAGATVFLVILTAIGFLVLIQFNLQAVLIGSASLILVVIYPFMKRVTYWPQLFLGLAFNWGIFVGWVAVAGELTLAPIILYAGAICWTIGYDTIYAHQDKQDDRKIGVKSTALAFGERSGVYVGLFYSAFVLFAVASFAVAGLSWWFGVLIGAVAAQLAWQVITVDLDDVESCMQRFASNWQIGILVFSSIVIGRLAL